MDWTRRDWTGGDWIKGGLAAVVSILLFGDLLWRGAEFVSSWLA